VKTLGFFSLSLSSLQDVLEFPNSLEGVLVLKKALDYEVDKEFKIAIRAQVTINLKSLH